MNSVHSLRTIAHHYFPRLFAQRPSVMRRESRDGGWRRRAGKTGVTVGASDFSALQALRDQLGSRFSAGGVLYLGDQVVPFGDKLTLVPLPALWAK
jgi:hypothetical protein